MLIERRWVGGFVLTKQWPPIKGSMNHEFVAAIAVVPDREEWLAAAQDNKLGVLEVI